MRLRLLLTCWRAKRAAPGRRPTVVGRRSARQGRGVVGCGFGVTGVVAEEGVVVEIAI